MFYKSAIDTGPYVEFLRNAISTKKEMKIVSQDRADIGAARLIGSWFFFFLIFFANLKINRFYLRGEQQLKKKI